MAIKQGGFGESGEFVQPVPFDASVGASAATERVTAARTRRILVIDDNRDVADSLAMLMENFEAEVRASYDGASGVEAAAEFRPHIVFIDIRMPEMDGYETARRLRARLGQATPMLAALTGLGKDQEREQTREAGFEIHLTKPVSADALEALLRRAEAG